MASHIVLELKADILVQVNKKVGKGLASALDAGEEVTEKSKQALGIQSSSRVFSGLTILRQVPPKRRQKR